MVTSINNPQTMGLGFRDASSVPRYNTPTGTTTPTQNAAANLGYERGTSSILSGMTSMIPGGNFIKGPLGIGANDTFGNEGTADSQGNVFDSTGRAWDPITGRAVASYDDLGAGVNTIKNSYGKLRAHGEGPISSALGSYDNSIYKQMDDQRNPDGSTITKGEARTARLRGEGAPLSTVAGRIGTNTNSMEDNFNESGDAYINNKPISPYDLGFDGSRAGTPKSTSGVFGSNAGDIIPTNRMSEGFGVMGADSDTSITYDNEGNYKGGDISIMTPGGSMSSITDSVTGESIQTNTMSPLLKQELDRRAGNDNNEHHRIIEPDGGGPNGKIKSIPSRVAARKMNEFGDVISDDGDNATDSNSGGK
tara:strand:- start:241 stop:1332 length:1092 start_codon:yes stop_codon:yes gene_type:complete